MTLLLAAALLLAMAFSANTPAGQNLSLQKSQVYEYGNLTFVIPPDWRPMPAELEKPLEKSQLNLVNTQNTSHTLTLGVLPAKQMRSPQVAMQEALNLLLADQTYIPVMQTRVRQGAAAAYLHVELTYLDDAGSPTTQSRRIPTKSSQSGVLNHLFVFSQDARQYIVIHHAQRVKHDDSLLTHSRQQLTPALQLILAIASQTRDSQFQIARHEDLALAGFADDQPVKPLQDTIRSTPNAPAITQVPVIAHESDWMLMHNQIASEDPSIYVIPTGGNPAFWSAQLSGSVAPPADNIAGEGENNQAQSNQFTGPQLLAFVQNNQTKNQPPASKIVPISHLSIKGWKLVSTAKRAALDGAPDDAEPLINGSMEAEPLKHAAKGDAYSEIKNDGLVRELWYVPTTQGRVIVAQLIAEPSVLKYATAQLSRAIVLLQSQTSQAQTQAGSNDSSELDTTDNWAQAVARGTKFVSELRESALSSHKPGLVYSVIWMESRPIGFSAWQTKNDDEALPIHGRSMNYILDEPPVVSQSAWSSNATLTRMWQTYQKYQAGPSESDDQQVQPRESYRQELTDGILKGYDLSSAENHSTIKASWVYEAHSNYLPSHGLTHLSPSLLEAWAGSPPAAVMCDLDQTEPEPYWLTVKKDDDNWLLTLRPMADVQQITIWYDATGKNLKTSWTGTFTDNVLIRFFETRSDRDTILDAFNSLKPQIIAWEKEWQPHEKQPQ